MNAETLYRVFQKKMHKVHAPQFCNLTSQCHAVLSIMFRKKLFTRRRPVS